MTIFDSRPDPLYVRTRGREGMPPGCGHVSCWCGGGPAVWRTAEQRRKLYQAPADPDGSQERAPKDPRYTWLPW